LKEGGQAWIKVHGKKKRVVFLLQIYSPRKSESRERVYDDEDGGERVPLPLPFRRKERKGPSLSRRGRKI